MVLLLGSTSLGARSPRVASVLLPTPRVGPVARNAEAPRVAQSVVILPRAEGNSVAPPRVETPLLLVLIAARSESEEG